MLKFADLPGTENETLAYVVYSEHTLGYLYRDGGIMWLGVLHRSTLKGATFSVHDDPCVMGEQDQELLRRATRADFKEYRVCSKGYAEEGWFDWEEADLTVSYRVYGKYKDERRFLPMDLKEGIQVNKLIFASILTGVTRKDMDGKIERLHKQNPDWKFEWRKV